jgi:hypothetical protein
MAVSTQKLIFLPYRTGSRLAWWLPAMRGAMDSTKTPLSTMNQIHTNFERIRKGPTLFSPLLRLVTPLTWDLRLCKTSSFSQARNFRTEWWRRSR